MKVGIVSDTHGKLERLNEALDQLLGRGAEAMVHCGDIGSAECLAALGARWAPAWAVAGNMDRRLPALIAAARKAGVQFGQQVVQLPVGDGRRLAATHGNDPGVLASLIGGGEFAYVCHGHTHRRRDERIGACRVINPGALHRPRDTRATAALLETATDTVEFVDV